MTEPQFPDGARPVVDFDNPRETIPGFCVREDGTVLYWYARGKRWVPLKPKRGTNGFTKVRLKHHGREREIGVALLVLRAFVGPRPLGCEPLHYPDADPGNNRLDNLRWGPRGASKMGRQLGPTLPVPIRGDNHAHARLTAADIPRVRELYRAGVAYPEIADRFDVSEEAIRHVLIGRTWKHVPDPLGPIVMRRRGPWGEDSANAKLDFQQAEEIRGHHAAGLSYRQIGKLYEIDRCTVRDIVKGRTWKSEQRTP